VLQSFTWTTWVNSLQQRRLSVQNRQSAAARAAATEEGQTSTPPSGESSRAARTRTRARPTTTPVPAPAQYQPVGTPPHYPPYPFFEDLVTRHVEQESLMIEWMEEFWPFTTAIRDRATARSDPILDGYFPHRRTRTATPQPTAQPRAEPTAATSEEETDDDDSSYEVTVSEQLAQRASTSRVDLDSDSDYQP